MQIANQQILTSTSIDIGKIIIIQGFLFPPRNFISIAHQYAPHLYRLFWTEEFVGTILRILLDKIDEVLLVLLRLNTTREALQKILESDA